MPGDWFTTERIRKTKVVDFEARFADEVEIELWIKAGGDVVHDDPIELDKGQARGLAYALLMATGDHKLAKKLGKKYWLSDA